MRHKGLDPLPCHFNLQRVSEEASFLTSNLEACPAPLLVMARDGDLGEHPWGEGSNHDGRQPPTRWARMDIGPDRASSLTWWGFSLRQRLPRLVSCDDANRGLMEDVGFLLRARRRRQRCRMSCRSSSSPGIWSFYIHLQAFY
jgi:hypothetical protein